MQRSIELALCIFVFICRLQQETITFLLHVFISNIRSNQSDSQISLCTRAHEECGDDNHVG